MSKSNVNPNHYKVAGRERQGEDIAQARNKQKHAENLVRQRTELGARSRKPASQQDGSASPDAAPTRSAKTPARRTRATPLQTPPGHKRGHNLVPKSPAPHASSPKAARDAPFQPTGAASKLNAKQAPKQASGNPQGADKRRNRSTAQKRASSRHEFDSMPATSAVAGAFGKEPSPRRRPTRKG
jgi:hypothetical protein